VVRNYLKKFILNRYHQLGYTIFKNKYPRLGNISAENQLKEKISKQVA